MTKWIPVKEKLPTQEPWSDVLAYVTLYPKSPNPVKSIQTATFFPSQITQWCVDAFDDRTGHYKVTHWMHLPKPPEGDSA